MCTMYNLCQFINSTIRKQAFEHPDMGFMEMLAPTIKLSIFIAFTVAWANFSLIFLFFFQVLFASNMISILILFPVWHKK